MQVLAKRALDSHNQSPSNEKQGCLADFAEISVLAPSSSDTRLSRHSSNVRTFAPLSTIFEQGEKGTELFIVLAGSVTICKRTGSGLREVATLGCGEFFGEMAVVDRRPRSASAVAGSDGAEVLAVDTPHFMYLVSQQPGFALIVMEALSKRQRAVIGDEPSIEVGRNTTSLYEVVPIDEACFQFRSRSRSSNSYLFKGGRQTVLVDAGLPSSASALCSALQEVGISPADIDTVVLTHEHFDHMGAVPTFSNAIVTALDLAANKINLNDEFATLVHAFGERYQPVEVGGSLNEDSVIDTGVHRLQVAHTPGHTSGSISLIDHARGILVSGDTLMKGGPIGGVFGSGSISDMIHSLTKLKKCCDPKVLLPGHGPLSMDAKADLDTTLRRCRGLMADSQSMFDVLRGTESVDVFINSYRNLNRGFVTNSEGK